MTENPEAFSDTGNGENENNNNNNVFDDSEQIHSETFDNNNNSNNTKTDSQASNNIKTTYNNNEENAAAENSFMFSKGITQKEFEWKRYKNWEESSPLICNLFYCFYFPFICRIAPLREENIPQISENDKSQLNTDIFREQWEPVAKEYGEKMLEYERKKKINKKFVILFSFKKF